ncbi:hypothetical protein QCA50_002084 [Cerrena zonata]|uniref:Uncharacterized protein n=1 Tax=Cerrena zonata TaxID=2478898 RepID=A0AAW0GN45_9APHY
MASTSSTTLTPYARWNSIPDDELTLNDIQECLIPASDDLWVVAACADRLVNDLTLQQALLDLGLKRTEAAVERSRSVWDKSPN